MRGGTVVKMYRVDGYLGAEEDQEQDCEDRMLPSRSGKLEMKAFLGGAVIANDSCQDMIMDWVRTMEKITRLRRSRPLGVVRDDQCGH